MSCIGENYRKLLPTGRLGSTEIGKKLGIAGKAGIVGHIKKLPINRLLEQDTGLSKKHRNLRANPILERWVGLSKRFLKIPISIFRNLGSNRKRPEKN